MEPAKELDCIQFEAGEESELRKRISRNTRGLSQVTVSRPEQLFLDRKEFLTLSGGYALSWVAMTQAARYMANGSCALLLDLCGRRSERPASVGAAITIYNELIKSRFKACLLNKQLLVDRSRKLIVAVVPAEYRPVNSELVLDIFDSMRPRTSTFAGGVLTGTRAVLEYSVLAENRQSLPDWLNPIGLGFVVDIDESAQSGFKLLRTVTFGKAVRAVRFDDSNEIAKQAQRKREHRIRAYLGLVDRVVGVEAIDRTMQAYDRPSLVETLGFGSRIPENDRVMDAWIRWLRHKGLTEAAARAALRRTLQSAGEFPALPEQLDFGSRDLWASRCVRDLYMAVAADNADRPFNLNQRLATDRIVYSLLFEGGHDPYADAKSGGYGKRRRKKGE